MQEIDIIALVEAITGNDIFYDILQNFKEYESKEALLIEKPMPENKTIAHTVAKLYFLNTPELIPYSS